MFHEGAHAKQYLELGKASYVKLGVKAREEHVYNQIVANSKSFNNAEINSAKKYITKLKIIK